MLPFTFAITALAALAGTADAYLFNQCASLDITSDVLIDLENAIDTLFSPANSYSGCPVSPIISPDS